MCIDGTWLWAWVGVCTVNPSLCSYDEDSTGLYKIFPFVKPR
jgi:hypothetical protein